GLVALAWGIKGILIFWGLVYVLLILHFIGMSEDRHLLLRSGELTVEDKEVKFLCRHGFHFWDRPVEEEAVTAMAKIWRSSRRFRFGHQKALCCDRERLVDTFVSMSPTEKDYWFPVKDDSLWMYQEFRDYNKPQ
ncbi:MAG: hypothetical protein KGI60_00755, partial [Patescibacteria group bacterium]|nr:hypothetical protein [Patescibacteria group bacterium]